MIVNRLDTVTAMHRCVEERIVNLQRPIQRIFRNGQVNWKSFWLVDRKGKPSVETQLKDRYLKNNQCRFGLYLVGWFNCPQWDTNDLRQQRAPKLTKDEAQEKFDQQANLLSNEGTILRALVLNTGLSS